MYKSINVSVSGGSWAAVRVKPWNKLCRGGLSLCAACAFVPYVQSRNIMCTMGPLFRQDTGH